MAMKQDKEIVWKKRGIIIGALGVIVAMSELFSSTPSIAMLIVGLVAFAVGVILAGRDYLKYQDMLIAEKKKVRAAKKALLECEERVAHQQEQIQQSNGYKEQERANCEESPTSVLGRLQLSEAIKERVISEHEDILTKQKEWLELTQKYKDLFDEVLQSIPRSEIVVGEKVNRNKEIDFPDINFKNITRRTNISKLFPLVVIDIETTGLKATADIIEVAAIKFSEGFKAESCISMLCKPRKPIPEEATEVNGITDDMVKDCPNFSQIAANVTAYIKDCTIVGHNLDFDIKRLFISGVALPEKVSYFDTLKLARYVLKAENSKKYNYKSEQYEEVEDWDITDYKLDTLCEHYGIYRNDTHRALSDCLATARLFESLIEDKTAVERGEFA